MKTTEEVLLPFLKQIEMPEEAAARILRTAAENNYSIDTLREVEPSGLRPSLRSAPYPAHGVALRTDTYAALRDSYAGLFDPADAAESYNRLREAVSPDPDGFKILTLELLAACEAADREPWHRILAAPGESASDSLDSAEGILNDTPGKTPAAAENKSFSGQYCYTETMKCFTRFVTEYHTSYGRYGFDRGFWAYRQIEGVLFRLGVLEYEILPDQAELQSGTTAADTTQASVGGSGAARETTCGKINIHIPGGAPLTEETIADSYREARTFLARFFPGTEDWPMECESWLLSPALPHLLPETSRILLFQRHFTLREWDEDASDYLEWVYHFAPGQIAAAKQNLPALPENTSLQRRMKAHLLDGGKIGVGTGLFHL